MGTVYKARDTQLDRDVALKLLRKDLGPEYANQLQQEARITASVNHPHVVQVFSFGRDHDQYYLVMELVDRERSMILLRNKKNFPKETYCALESKSPEDCAQLIKRVDP